MKLVRRGSWSTLEFVPDREAIYSLLDPKFSYRMEGAQYSEAYKEKRWDGRIHLIRRGPRGTLKWPSGLDLEVNSALDRDDKPAHVVDGRPSGTPTFRAQWTGHPPREYQQQAVDEAYLQGHGIIRLPIRAGKTLVAAALIRDFGTRALFVVPSDLLLRQSAEAFRDYLGGVKITTVGAGEWDASGDIVVATIQTLAARADTKQFQFEIACGIFPLMCVDELHHLGNSGDAWRDTMLGIRARWKIGFSATVDLNQRKRCESSAIWLRGMCGPIVASRTMDDLMTQGFLVRPTVKWIEHGAPPDETEGPWQSTYKRCLVDCEARNKAIVEAASQEANQGAGVLVDTSRVGHARALGIGIARRIGNPAVSVLTGSTSRAKRSEVLTLFRTGRVRVLCGTILGEGIDLPELDVVVNAEGSKDRTPVIQRLRNLTPDPKRPDKRATIYEMVDRHSKLLAGWTKARARIYAAEKFHQEFP